MLRRKLRELRTTHRKRAQAQAELIDEFTPRTIYDDDVFLVSFPRSGNTWLRFMLANLISPAATDIHFRNVNAFVPPVLALPQVGDKVPRPRLIKSHSPLHDDYPRVVYILRDGRAAYSSYFHYLKHELPDDLTPFKFVTDYEMWPCRWESHVTDWLAADWPPDRFLLLHYESMKADPHATLTRVARFANLDHNPATIAAAVEAASLSNMQRGEEKHGGPGGRAKAESPFVQNGSVNAWEAIFNSAEIDTVNARLKTTLTLGGYAVHA